MVKLFREHIIRNFNSSKSETEITEVKILKSSENIKLLQYESFINRKERRDPRLDFLECGISTQKYIIDVI